MQITYYFRTSILVLACILPAFTPALASGASTVPDSLLTEKYIRSIYISAPDSALHLLDEAEKRRLTIRGMHTRANYNLHTHTYTIDNDAASAGAGDNNAPRKISPSPSTPPARKAPPS